MPLLLETIKIENGKIQNLEYHNRRFNASRRAMFGFSALVDLSELINIPPELETGIFRCRVLYKDKIESTEFIPHQYRYFKSLKIIKADNINYSFKYADRNSIQELFKQRGACDEILIVKKGLITDTSISNIIFRQKNGYWVTPYKPLLNGTMRMSLIEKGQIRESVIRPSNLHEFTGAKLINCMMEPGDSPLIEINQIIP